LRGGRDTLGELRESSEPALLDLSPGGPLLCRIHPPV